MCVVGGHAERGAFLQAPRDELADLFAVWQKQAGLHDNLGITVQLKFNRCPPCPTCPALGSTGNWNTEGALSFFVGHYAIFKNRSSILTLFPSQFQRLVLPCLQRYLLSPGYWPGRP